MSLKHGAHFTGCCWFLMALLFVAGVMNVWWIALLAVLVLVEKVVPKRFLMARIASAPLVLWGRGSGRQTADGCGLGNQ